MSRAILRGAGAAILYTVTAAAAGMLQLRLVMHFLPPAVAGLWTLFVTCGTYIALFDLGLAPTVGREVSLLSASASSGNAVATLLRTASACSRYLASLVFVISLGGGLALLFATSHRDATTLLAWALFSLGSAANLLGSSAFAGLFGLGCVADEKVIRCVSLVAGVLLSLGFLRCGWGTPGLALAWTLQGLLARGLAAWRLRQVLGADTLGTAAPDWPQARKLAVPSIQFAGIQVASVAIFQSANPIIAARIGVAAIPAYEAVSRLALTLMTLALIIASSSTPFLSMAYAAGDRLRFKQLLSRNLRSGMAVVLFPLAFLAVFGDRVIDVWLGPHVFPGFAVLWTLLTVVLLEVHHVIFASAVMATGRVIFVPAAVLAASINLLLAFLLAPRLGLLGIAISIAIAQLTTNNWYAPYQAHRIFGLHFGESLRTVILPSLSLLTLQLGLCLAFRHVLPAALPQLASLALGLLLSCSLGSLPCLWLFLQPEERQLFRRRIFRKAAA